MEGQGGTGAEATLQVLHPLAPNLLYLTETIREKDRGPEVVCSRVVPLLSIQKRENLQSPLLSVLHGFLAAPFFFRLRYALP
jgi:hypothetical protein